MENDQFRIRLKRASRAKDLQHSSHVKLHASLAEDEAEANAQVTRAIEELEANQVAQRRMREESGLPPKEQPLVVVHRPQTLQELV